MKWLRLTFSIFLMEARKLMAYRLVFFGRFFGATIVQIILGYYTWKSVFESNDLTQMGGFDLEQMTFYYFLAPMIMLAMRGQSFQIISADIYQGTLNKFLLFPTSVFLFKLFTHLTHTYFFIAQLAVSLLVYNFYFKSFPFPLTSTSIFVSIIFINLASILYFYMVMCIEQVSFWAENTWSLNVLLRMVTNFLGGAVIPLQFFPEWSVELLQLTPFPLLVSIPLKIMIGSIPLNQLLTPVLVILIWILLFFLLAKFMWRSGSKVYSGVGI
jgi:ABC-2 type transport system permease protein